MANLLGLFIGAGLGALIARNRGGSRMDLLHYAGVFGLIGLIISSFVAVFLLRG